jgi:hypothetical protein
MSDTNPNGISSEDTVKSEINTATPSIDSSPVPSIQSQMNNTFPNLTDRSSGKIPAGLKAVCRPKPATSVCLDKSLFRSGDLYFRNIVDAKASMDNVQWRAPAPDDTIPQTDKEHQDIVRKLVWAFKDMSVAKDTAENAYRKRLTTGEPACYPDWAIEACAWDIVVSLKTETT